MSLFETLFPQANAIIFDLGGVIFNVDYQLTQKAFEALGFDNFSQLYSQVKQTGLFDELEIGRISPSVFRNEIRKLKPNLSLSDNQIDEAWSAMLINLPTTHIPLLLALKKTYRTFLFSNTNVIHLEKLAIYLQKNFGIESLDYCFEKAYYSSSIGLRKPDIASFTTILKENNLDSQKTVFIDDLPQNIEGAKNAGLLVYHLTNNEKITNLFS